MTLRTGIMSLKGASSTNFAGSAVQLGREGYHKVVFGVTFPGGGSTKCSVRAQVQGAGPSTRWVSIGSANSTISSTQAGRNFTSTSATPFTRARLVLVTRSTGATSAADSVSGWITGARP